VEACNWDTYHSERRLVDFNGVSSKHVQTIEFQINFNQREVKNEAVVVDKLKYDFIVGFPTMKELGITWNIETGEILEINMDEHVFSQEDILKHFPKIAEFNTEPTFTVDFKITPGSIVKCKPYRLSREKMAFAQEKIKELKDKGIIRDSTSPYASPCVITPKANGKLRLCQDFRAINKLTELDPFPFPLIDNIINDFGGCRYFSKIDLKDGFHIIGLSEETRKYTAFVLPFGHYESNRLLFGWKNAPQIFQRIMTKVLEDIILKEKVRVYIDDILIAGFTKEENAKLNYKVLKRLAENRFPVNLEKTLLMQTSIEFLGRVIDGQTKTTRQESVEKVLKMRRPFDLHTLRCFTGLTGHFRAYIQDYASLVRPLDKLKQKDVPFIWSDECQSSYEALVNKITSNPILQVPDWRLPFELTTDASNFGTGAVLYQRDVEETRNRQLRVIGYYSYTFTKAEINYSTTDKEELAVIKAIKYFMSFIEGHPFTVHTDHQALTT